jgi:hypothetical protein
MNPIRTLIVAAGAAVLLAPSFAGHAAAQTSQTPPKPSPTEKSAVEKMNAYVGCINRLSERSYESRKRYFSWAAQSGPTGKERIIYGTYTIYDTADCKKNVEKANALEPRDAALEAGRGKGYLGAWGTTPAVPAPDPIDHPYLSTADELVLHPGVPRMVTLLMLPGSALTVTCGVVPRQQLRLSRAWFAGGLEKLSPSVRVGPVLRWVLSRRVEVRGSFVLTVYSPDRIGLVGSDFTELGVRYRWATE